MNNTKGLAFICMSSNRHAVTMITFPLLYKVNTIHVLIVLLMTLCTESTWSRLWWKSFRIFGRISLPSSGDGITSGRWCHMTLLDHVTPVGIMTAGMSRPLSLFSPGIPWWILMASLILLLDTWSSLSILSRCSPTDVLLILVLLIMVLDL